MDRITFLGHMVFGEEVSIDPAMVKGVISLDQPINTEDVCKFLSKLDTIDISSRTFPVLLLL